MWTDCEVLTDLVTFKKKFPSQNCDELINLLLMNVKSKYLQVVDNYT